MSQQASVDNGRTFFRGSSGTWAGMRFLAHMKQHGELSPAALRTLDTLRKDEWVSFDEALVEEGQLRLRAVQDLVDAGLVSVIPNGLGKTVREWEQVTDMEAAEISLDGNARSEDDRQEFELNSLPLPITHKDFSLNLRTLLASRERGEPLDTSQVRNSGRRVAESIESVLLNGTTKVFGGFPIFGYTTHPDRNTAGFAAGVWSASARTGAEILTDVLAMITALQGDKMFGPYWLYLPSNTSTKFDEDFKAETSQTIRQRILEVDGLGVIQTVDQLTADNIVMVQGTRDVAEMVQGEPLQTVQWEINGGFTINFKAFTIMVPLVKSTASGDSGIFHMS